MNIDLNKEIGLGSRLKRVSESMMREIQEVYVHYNIDFDPYLFPVFSLVANNKEITTTDITETLNVSQPAITQMVNKLVQKELIEVYKDKKDKRKKMIALSVTGQTLHRELLPLWKSMEECVKELTQYKSESLIEHLDQLEGLLNKQKLNKMIIEHHNQKTLENVQIVSFQPQWSKDFKELNLEWLKNFFVVEPHDEEVLENAKSYIIDNGGFIFFAKLNDKITGTVALIKMENGVYELSKMAVSPKFRGLKTGQQLMQHCINFAKEQKWKKLILYSNTKLKNAIHIYRKYGFIEVPVEKGCPYLRCNIKMELKTA